MPTPSTMIHYAAEVLRLEADALRALADRLDDAFERAVIRVLGTESRIVVTGIGSSNCVYHAVIGFHIRNFYSIVPEDCIHGVHPESQPFALHQFRSGAYNFNVTVAHSDDLQLVSESMPLQRASGT